MGKVDTTIVVERGLKSTWQGERVSVSKHLKMETGWKLVHEFLAENSSPPLYRCWTTRLGGEPNGPSGNS